ncbi:NAD-dependent malic enzyme [archaeon]|nr:NAD-dependent malic enzyme [archaeon]|tara:strand:+ start:2453 stop:3619 length:1167 start_codon:yes stop_codon:yes gene_type:complete
MDGKKQKKNYNKLSLEMHEIEKGKLQVISKIPVKTTDDLSIAYTPGVAEPCRRIAINKELAYKYTIKQNTVAVVSDGSAVLGLGNIGPEAALPVMEGKALLFKEFANVDAFPIVLNTQDTEEIIQTVKNIAPGFGGINLEDISAPRCFEIEKRLVEELKIPVMHDDQHGTAIVTLAGLINSLKLCGKQKEEIKIILNGAGAAGIAITRLLLKFGCKNIILCDSKGTIHEGRDDLNSNKKEMAMVTNKENIQGGLTDAIVGSDILIGISVADQVTKDMVKSMNQNPIIFAMANPVPEIMPEIAKDAGAFIIATGRSDFPNQINNVLAFPGIFRGALDARITKITNEMKISAAYAIANKVDQLTVDNIIPSPLDKSVVLAVAEAVGKHKK